MCVFLDDVARKNRGIVLDSLSFGIPIAKNAILGCCCVFSVAALPNVSFARERQMAEMLMSVSHAQNIFEFASRKGSNQMKDAVRIAIEDQLLPLQVTAIIVFLASAFHRNKFIW